MSQKSFTPGAWIILIIVAIIVGSLLAYLFLPTLSSIQQEEPDTVNYQIPVSKTPQLKK